MTKRNVFRSVFVTVVAVLATPSLVMAECGDKGDPKVNLENLIISIKSRQEPQRRGCCSWHGGVCGCSSGRAVCCDGSYSPSCGC